MKHLFAFILVGVFSCTGQEDLADGNVESMEAMAKALEEAPPPPMDVPREDGSTYSFKDEKTHDCHGGGTVLVKVNWSLVENPFTRRYYVSWEYDACVTMRYGTINGKSHYSKNNEDKGDFWFTGVNYYADLVYSGSVEAECDAYVAMTTKTQEQERDLKVSEHCKHPVSHWWLYWK